MLEAIQDTNPVNIDSRQSWEKSLFDGLSLPPEIWLLIFPNLKSSDLRTVSSVCKSFRYMAQPLLFSVLDVSPFLLRYSTAKPILRPKNYLSRLVARLECYKQPHIAPGVHHCWVSPYTRSAFPPRNPQLEDDLDPHSIINALLECLPSFPNLSALSWHCIDITPNWWSVIQSLNIKKLWLNSSSIPSSSNPLSAVVHLDLDHWPQGGRVTNQVSIQEARGHGVDQTALEYVIQPDVILSISVARADTACHVFFVLSQTISQLQVLKIPFVSISDSKFIATLRMCPRLEVLCIFPPITIIQVPDIVLDTLPPTCLPRLENYDGPYTHLLNICHQPLKHVSLWGFHRRAALCDPEALTKTLNSLAHRKSVKSLESLTVLVNSITLGLLESFSEFKYLEHLTVRSQESVLIRPRIYISALYDMLGTVELPSSLKSIKLLTHLDSDKGLPVQEHRAASFVQAFATQYPRVQQIDIEYGMYRTGMYSAKWGRIRQNNDQSLISKEGDSSVAWSAVRKVSEGSGYSIKSSSDDYLVTSSAIPLHLGKLTFVEHPRMNLFRIGPPRPAPRSRPIHHHSVSVINEPRPRMDLYSGLNEPKPRMNLWLRLKRLFGKNSA